MSNLSAVEQELASLQLKINEAEQKRNEAKRKLEAAIEQEKPESIRNDLRALYEGAVSELNGLRQEKVALIENTTRVNDIVTHKFPPLGKRQLYSSDKSKTRLKSNYEVIPEVSNAEFGILQEFKSEHLKKVGSSLWFEAKTGSLRNWSGEVDIQTYVKNALIDCMDSSPLLEKVDIYREQTFSVAALMQKGNKVDVTVFVKDTSFITGVAEVKLPGSNLDHFHQIVDYMVDLRNSFNVRFVFGVLTTYEQWKILWFEDTQEAAQCNTKGQYDELCLAGSANEYMINAGIVKVFQSKSYKYDDPELIECLTTLLYKVSTTPVYNPTKFIDERSRYVFATEKSIQYMSLPKDLKYFKYGMPPKQTRNLFILSYFHRGGDGRVALVSSASGCLGVVKFLHDTDNQEEMESALQVEQSRWKELWEVECRIVNLNGRLGLLMPFCMPFNTHRAMFSSLQAWNKISTKYEYDFISDELTELVNKEELEKYNRDPLLAAQEALSTVCSRNSSHLDISFRHIALLPKWNNGTNMYDFQAILIDLSRVHSGQDVESTQLSAQNALESLKNEFENINTNI